jgi:hypothetical protein
VGRRNEAFEIRVHRMVGAMLQALSRRRDRAQSRAARLDALYLGREPTGEEHAEREQWLQVEHMYDRAYDAVHAAGVAVHYAGGLVSRLLRDRQQP